MPFEKGKSGNPEGRRRNAFVQEALIVEMKSRAAEGDKRGVRALAVKVWELAESGERWAAEFLRDTIDGKPVQAVEGEVAHTGDEALMGLLGRIAAAGQPLVPLVIDDGDDQH